MYGFFCFARVLGCQCASCLLFIRIIEFTECGFVTETTIVVRVIVPSIFVGITDLLRTSQGQAHLPYVTAICC